MKKIDRLMQKAKGLIKEVCCRLTSNEDGFITALIEDPSPYATKQADGSTGYDILEILNDLAKEDWKGTEP